MKLLISEIGNSHMGDMDKAKEIYTPEKLLVTYKSLVNMVTIPLKYTFAWCIFES